MNYRIQNKWIVVFGAMSAQVAIGALYAWSMFNKPIATAFDTDITSVYVTYTIALASFALTMILSGKKQLDWGPRKTALIGGLLYSGGVILSSFATSTAMLYLTYGVITGAGVAFVYVCPLSTLVKWFPTKKGLVTGLATAGFALGGFTFKFVLGALFDVPAYTPEVVSSVFLTVGLIYAVMTIGGALLLDVPQDAETLSKSVADEGKNYSRTEMLKTGTFYKLLISDLLALMPGLLVIGLAKDIGEQFAGLSLEFAGTVVALIAIVNASGRLASGFLADKIGALRVYRTMYVVTILSLAVLAFTTTMSIPVFLLAIFGVAIGYGSFLSLVPTIVGRLFGGKFFSANYALVFQAYGIAALVGPIIKKSTEGNFSATFTIAMATSVVGLVFAMLIKPEKVQEVTE
jgi:OFA family oxalate/formate antiporter-like MFS transporter